MPKPQTKINIADNSGIKVVKCIKVITKFTKRGNFFGRFIIVSVQELKSSKAFNSKVKKGQLLKAFVVRTKRSSAAKNGTVKAFHKSFAVLLTKQNNFIGTRVFGILPKQIGKFKKIKLGALALGFV